MCSAPPERHVQLAGSDHSHRPATCLLRLATPCLLIIMLACTCLLAHFNACIPHRIHYTRSMLARGATCLRQRPAPACPGHLALSMVYGHSRRVRTTLS